MRIGAPRCWSYAQDELYAECIFPMPAPYLSSKQTLLMLGAMHGFGVNIRMLQGNVMLSHEYAYFLTES